MNDKSYKNFRYWAWFSTKNQDELYDVISGMIKDKIEELVPEIIDKILNEKREKISFDI